MYLSDVGEGPGINVDGAGVGDAELGKVFVEFCRNVFAEIFLFFLSVDVLLGIHEDFSIDN